MKTMPFELPTPEQIDAGLARFVQPDIAALLTTTVQLLSSTPLSMGCIEMIVAKTGVRLPVVGTIYTQGFLLGYLTAMAQIDQSGGQA